MPSRAVGRSRPEVILFEDERFLALEKPSGLSLATPRGRDGEAVDRLLQSTGLDPERPAFLLHRLDVGTSGVVLLAKDPEAHRRGSALFQERRIEKIYRAVVWGHPVPAHGVIEAALGMDREDRRRMRVVAAGKPAKTEYRTLERPSAIAHLELSPRTGRTHQIRVHLAFRGHPVVGDDLYAGPRWRGVADRQLRRRLEETPRLLLHALRLSFDQPFDGVRVVVESPEPAAFEELLAAARRATAQARARR